METAADRLEGLLHELRRRALRVAGSAETREDDDSLVRAGDVARVEELIAENDWQHLRARR